VSVCPEFVFDGRSISFIDTPGFDDTDKSDAEIVQMIAAFLETQ
jgi:predicted GTPase